MHACILRVGARGLRKLCDMPVYPAARLAVQVPMPGVPGVMMKYGVISTHALVDDLLHWRSLYVSGRMHKPVRHRRGDRCTGILPCARTWLCSSAIQRDARACQSLLSLVRAHLLVHCAGARTCKHQRRR
ncbi:hypothetical protein EON66_12305 [archaeon]|nr:MAG: hypothetical protein EON66_12305 [archaeon]